MTKSKSAHRILLASGLLVLVFSLAVPATAQNYGQWDDDGDSLTATGNGKTFEGAFTGKDVHLVGDGQTVKLHGICGKVTSLGNNKTVTLDGAKSLKITGNGNTFSYKKKPGSIDTLGNDNTVKAAE